MPDGQPFVIDYKTESSAVTKERVNSMLEYEYLQCTLPLDFDRGDTTNFFTFADTLVARAPNSLAAPTPRPAQVRMHHLGLTGGRPRHAVAHRSTWTRRRRAPPRRISARGTSWP